MSSAIIGTLAVIFGLTIFFNDGFTQYDIPIPEGTFHENVKIATEPTNAIIFIDGNKIGKSPLKVPFWHAEKREIHIKAVPLQENQFEQNIKLKIPTIPRKLTIYMNTPPPVKIALKEKKEEPVKEKIIIKKEIIIKDKLIALPTIYFDFNQSIIKKTEKQALIKAANWLKVHNDYTINIYGYADETGDTEYNKKLSISRSTTIENFFIENNIPKNRIKVFGHGEITTVSQRGFTLETSLNRKVELKVQKIILGTKET
jgi:outer membrane protein OmpA-like peptidoglycan-associated protein